MQDATDTRQQQTHNFSRLTISQRGEVYTKSYFDNINSQLLFDQLKETDNAKDDLILVTPEDPTILLTAVVQSLLMLLRYDVINDSAKTLKDVKPGTSVGLIENREMHPGVFEGIEIQNGKLKFYCVKQPNGITTKIPPGREWRIQPYSSTESMSPRRKTTVYGKALEDMLDLPTGGLKAFQKSKMLVVAPDKSRLVTAIRDVKVGGDPLEAVFPVADYTSADDWHYVGSFGLNNLKQEPLIGLVANCDIAVDIAMRDPNYKLLLVDGAAKLRAHYASIERLNSDEYPRKVLCLLRPTDEDEIKTLHSMGIESFIWKREDFKDIELRTDSGIEFSQFKNHNQILNNLAGADPVYREVQLPSSIEEAIDEAYRTLRSLSHKVPSLPESGILIRWGISLLNSWLQLPLTIKDYDSYLQSSGALSGKQLSEKFTDFKNRIRSSYGLFIPSVNKDECEAMISKLDIIYNYFLTTNPKKDQLLSIVGRNTEDTIYVYCCQSGYTSAFNDLYGSIHRKAKNIEQLSVTPVEKAIVTGWSSRRNTAHGFLAPVKDLTFLVYRKELDSLQYVYRSHPASPESNYDRNTRVALGNVNETDPTAPDDKKDESIESILEYVSTKFNTPLYPSYEAKSDTPDVIEARQILFEDGSIVYADTEHKFDKIDRSARKIQRPKASELTEGDELVFADSERSMFEELLSILQKSEEYRNVSAVANIWREALQKYVEDKNVSDQELVTMFKMVGCPRTVHTIRSWLKGNVIGPSYDNYSAVGAIAKITRDSNLEDKHDEVIRACKTLHALHVKTGWLLVRNIINSALEPEEDEDINEETRERLKAYSGSAKLKVIKAISEDTFSVPVNEIGQLHEAYL